MSAADEIEIMELKEGKFRLWMERYRCHRQFHLVCFLACIARKITVAEGCESTVVAMAHENGDVFWNPETGFASDCQDVIIGILWENFGGLYGAVRF